MTKKGFTTFSISLFCFFEALLILSYITWIARILVIIFAAPLLTLLDILFDKTYFIHYFDCNLFCNSRFTVLGFVIVTLYFVGICLFVNFLANKFSKKQ